MACRKAAYRAMTEMSEWMQEQQEKANASLEAFEKEQQQFWTPPPILEGCCMKWLADGREILGHSSSSAGGGGGGIANHLNTKGCNGGCNKDHPRITLEWQDMKKEIIDDSNSVGGCGVAILSHPLDPLLKYFDSLCQQGLAIKNSESNPLEYNLIGFLHTHIEKLKESSTVPFGYHLVKVSTKALAKSQRAHGRYMQEQEEKEELERQRRCHHQTKRLKICNDEDEKDKAAADYRYYQYRLDLLEKALDICYSYCSLQEHLDVCDIAWMRLSCKRPMGKIAARLAKFRITKQIRLSYSVLIHGMSSVYTWEPEGFLRQHRLFHHTTKVQNEQVKRDLIIPEEGKYYVESSRLPLTSASTADAPKNDGNDATSGDKTTTSGSASLSSASASAKGSCEKPAAIEAFIPTTATEHLKDCAPLLLWKDDQWGNEQGYGSTDTSVCFDRHYLGNLIRVYLEAPSDKCNTNASTSENNIISLPERDCLFTTNNPYLEVARYHIDPFHDGGGASRTATISSSSHSSNGNNDLSYKVLSTEKEENAYSIKYSGTFNINSIQFDFKDLLGVYARKKLPKAKEKLQQITNIRPATKSEKSYVKAIAKEAREAPGNSRDFQTLWGW